MDCLGCRGPALFHGAERAEESRPDDGAIHGARQLPDVVGVGDSESRHDGTAFDDLKALEKGPVHRLGTRSTRRGHTVDKG